MHKCASGMVKWLEEFFKYAFFIKISLYLQRSKKTSTTLTKYPKKQLPFVALYTDKKENLIFLIYREIQSGAVAKLYLTNGRLMYMVKNLRISSYIRKPFLVYDFATYPI